jgi:predicted RNase H-like nuclease (RuvC/YqgF family)
LDLSDEDEESMEATNWSDVDSTKEDNAAVTAEENNQIFEDQSQTVDEKPNSKVYRSTEDVEKFLALVSIDEKNEKKLEQCLAYVTTTTIKIQQLEADSEDLRQQMKAKIAEIEKQTKSIEEYKNRLENSDKKAKKIQELSMEIAQAQHPYVRQTTFLTIGENKQS